jgi:Na+/H+ antiporter NhaD/arsenite permease-like protein
MEVFKVFAAIFITAAPVIAILKAGEQGAFVGLVQLVNAGDGYNNGLYYWFTGGLSAFLDNAPTYLVFFNLAGGNPTDLMGPLSHTLIAISCGSVFMGALTYIGNAPNFMVKAIAEQNNIAMPSFFGYMVWSILILVPLFILADLLWI